jgi:putative endonuclease
MAYLYILKSSKLDKFYIGSTTNLEKRIEQHKAGKAKYTKSILPINLVFQRSFAKISEAQKAEKWLKKQKDKNLIIKIIREGFKKKFD